MKSSKLTSFLSVSTVTLTTILIPTSPTLAQKPKFFCGEVQNGSPATIVQSSQYGQVPIIIWDSGHFEGGGYDDQTRCNIVSGKFQTFSDQGTLTYFTAGKVNREPVICAVPSKSTACNGDTLLFTLKPGSDPQATLQRLFDVRGGITSQALHENDNVSAQDRTYVNFEEFLQKRASQESNISENLPAVNTESPETNIETKPLF